MNSQVNKTRGSDSQKVGHNKDGVGGEKKKRCNDAAAGDICNGNGSRSETDFAKQAQQTKKEQGPFLVETTFVGFNG